MEIVVTSAEMREFDRLAIGRFRIPGIVLMENAGRSVVSQILNHYGPVEGKSALIFCGKGNNGGDGFVVARHLHANGGRITVVLTTPPAQLKHDAKSTYEILKQIEGSIADPNVLRIVELKSTSRLKVLPKADIIVDALFGTGFSGKVLGIYQKIIQWINSQAAFRVSVDVPSGLNSDNGEVGNIAVMANLTVTFGYRKIGFVASNAIGYLGSLEVTDIGIPTEVSTILPSESFRVEERDIQSKLPKRPIDAHKHSVGKIFVLTGARGYTGAAAMVSQTAMQSGAGSVILGAPESIYPILAKKLTEVMVEPLEETSEGTLSLAALKSIQKHVSWSDLVIIGPGCSRNNETQELLRTIISRTNKPLLIDADGLNALAGSMALLKNRKSRDAVLTPHAGEFSRISGLSAAEIEGDRVKSAREFAKKFHVTLVLKGAPTITAHPDGQIFINSNGNPGMATAGSGDILSGIIGGLWAQGMKSTEAAYCGVFVHGLAGDFAAREFGQKSLMAMDILNSLPSALLHIERL